MAQQMFASKGLEFNFGNWIGSLDSAKTSLFHTCSCSKEQAAYMMLWYLSIMILFFQAQIQFFVEGDFPRDQQSTSTF